MKIIEIFSSIQGESTFAGLPCTFVRFAGCNLHCNYCDTLYAREGGQSWSVPQVLMMIDQKGFPLVALTGGEPLLQPELQQLTRELLNAGYTLLLETNGSLGLEAVDRRVIKIMDIKCPGSGMSQRMHFPNINYLTPRDQIKFVISDRPDFDWSVGIVKKYELLQKCEVLISPVLSRIAPAAVAEWILQARMPLRLQLQLHKIIWPNKALQQDRGY